MAVSSKSSAAQHSGRILLVDDNRSGLIARKAVLQELGYTVDGTTDPGKVLDLLEKQHYDLVVTDFKMPGCNGVELIGTIRETGSDVKVVLISGFVDALGLTEKNTGADAVIMKNSHEVSHLVRTANRLLKPPRKPATPDPGGSKLKRKAAAS